jgi:uncharacterized protein with von Willebrand factor type A (vWA) domain
MTRTEKQRAAFLRRTKLKDELCQEMEKFIDDNPNALCGAIWDHADAWLHRKVREMPQRRSEIILAGRELAQALRDQLANKELATKEAARG